MNRSPATPPMEERSAPYGPMLVTPVAQSTRREKITSGIQVPSPAAPVKRSWFVQFWHDVLFLVCGWAVALTAGAFFGSVFVSSILLLPLALVGVLLLPATLILAGYAADFTRMRYNLWVGEKVLPALMHRISVNSFLSYLRMCLDLRLWLDLLFEMVVSVTVRMLSFFILFLWGSAGVICTFVWIPALVFGANETSTFSYALASRLWGVAEGLEPPVLWLLCDSLLFFTVGIMLLGLLPFGIHFAARAEGWLTQSSLQGRAFKDMRLEGWATAVGLHIALVGWFTISVITATNYPAGEFLWFFAFFMCVGLVVATRRPALGAVLTAGTYGLLSVGLVLSYTDFFYYEGPSAWPMSFSLIFLFGFLLLFIGAQRRTVLAVVTYGSIVAITGMALAARVFYEGVSVQFVWPFVLLLFSAVGWIGAVAGGLGLRSLADTARSAAADRAAREEAETGRARAEMAKVQALYESKRSRQRSSELDERARIAREMHDVVAHSMSLISVQAQSAPYRLAGTKMDEETRQEFASIAATSRAALGEMRGLLTVLRGANTADEGAGSPNSNGARGMKPHTARGVKTAPQPTVADIPELVERTRAAGADVTLRMPDIPCEDTPSTAGLTLFRAVQEGLSNAMRHAPGARITVTLERDSEGFRLTVKNSGTYEIPVAAPSSGYGLRGIRERAGALGGEVTAEHEDDGGFVLTVALPHALP